MDEVYQNAVEGSLTALKQGVSLASSPAMAETAALYMAAAQVQATLALAHATYLAARIEELTTVN